MTLRDFFGDPWILLYGSIISAAGFVLGYLTRVVVERLR